MKPEEMHVCNIPITTEEDYLISYYCKDEKFLEDLSRMLWSFLVDYNGKIKIEKV